MSEVGLYTLVSTSMISDKSIKTYSTWLLSIAVKEAGCARKNRHYFANAITWPLALFYAGSEAGTPAAEKQRGGN